MRNNATVRLLAAVLLVTPSTVFAQRLSQLEPGTLVRIRTASG
jgi:hypothetical protein